jgi:hypothetical protein
MPRVAVRECEQFVHRAAGGRAGWHHVGEQPTVVRTLYPDVAGLVNRLQRGFACRALPISLAPAGVGALGIRARTNRPCEFETRVVEHVLVAMLVDEVVSEFIEGVVELPGVRDADGLSAFAGVCELSHSPTQVSC